MAIKLNNKWYDETKFNTELKNRYNDPTVNRKFILGVDRSKMRFYDVEQNAQTDLVDSGQDSVSSNDKFKRLGQFSDFKV